MRLTPEEAKQIGTLPNPDMESRAERERRLSAENAALRERCKVLEEALDTAIKVAGEARVKWDEAPEGMRAGKLLIALEGKCPGYRADIDAIHRAARKAIHNG